MKLDLRPLCSPPISPGSATCALTFEVQLVHLFVAQFYFRYRSSHSLLLPKLHRTEQQHPPWLRRDRGFLLQVPLRSFGRPRLAEQIQDAPRQGVQLSLLVVRRTIALHRSSLVGVAF